MSNVSEVLPDAVLNRHFPQGRPIGFRQPAGILIGAVCGTETGHRHSQHAGRIQPADAERVYHDDQSQRGIQSAGKTHHSCFAADMPQPCGKPHCL